MRRAKRAKYQNNRFTILAYAVGIVALATVLTFIVTYIVYKNKLKNAGESFLEAEQIIGLVPNNENIEKDTQTASTEIGKTIQEIQNTIQENVEIKNIKEDNNTEKETSITPLPTEEEKAEPETPVIIEEPEPQFAKPVEGEISREFANESLIYSDTLQEWITHLGIDIKADRTTVVKASEAGKIVSIKNDPRYGLTIIIEHSKGYKTIYSNLLTTEFITEGEKVEKGQSIATVGNSAVFEIADEPHLHFEILKDSQNIDPKVYL